MALLHNKSYNYTPEEILEYLLVLQHQSTLAYIPTFIFLSFLAMVGIPGNCLVIAVYITKMTMKPLSVFIISMAVIDLMTCTFILPVEIYILLHSYDFTSVLGCQLYIFFSCLLLINSDLTPVSIAIIRYKMVCTPHQRQVTLTQAKRLCCLNVCVAFIASIPQLLLQGLHSRRTPIPDIVGYHCQVDDSYVPTVWPGLSSAFLFLFFFLSCTTVTYMYFHIGIKVKSQRNKFQKRTRSRLSHIECDLIEGSLVQANTDIHSHHTTAVASNIVDLSCISKDGTGIDIMGDHNFAIENDSIENVLQTGNESDVPINCPNIMSEGKHVSINCPNIMSEGKHVSIKCPNNMSEGKHVSINCPNIMSEGKHLSINCPNIISEGKHVSINCPNIMSEGKHLSINDCIVSNVFMTSQNSPESSKARLTEKNKIIEPIVLITNQDNSFVLFDSLSSKYNNCVFSNDSKTIKTNMFPKDTHMDYLDIPSKREVSSNRINLVMFIVTLVYFLAFIPFLALNVFSAIYPETVASLEGVSLAFYMLFLDSYFLNCAVNPLVYSLLDNKFKKFSLELLSCCQ